MGFDCERDSCKNYQKIGVKKMNSTCTYVLITKYSKTHHIIDNALYCGVVDFPTFVGPGNLPHFGSGYRSDREPGCFLFSTCCGINT